MLQEFKIRRMLREPGISSYYQYWTPVGWVPRQELGFAFPTYAAATKVCEEVKTKHYSGDHAPAYSVVTHQVVPA